MAGRPKKEQEIVEGEESKKDGPQEVMKGILKDEKCHFNHIEPKKYNVSTGSLGFDIELNGGLKPSIIRCAGISEAGKSSFSLNVVKNFLDDLTRKRRGIYFLSDKELSEELRERSGVKFVENIDDWVDGTFYILRTNIYETVCNTIKKVIVDREREYIFVLDSMDNFAPQAALEGDFGDSFAKGGTGAISSHFFRCFSILLPRLGHITIMISQYRDSIQIGRQTNPTQKQMSTSGGRAIEHAVSWAFEFFVPMNSTEDMFWEGEAWKSKKIGHNCIVQLKKSINEKTGNKIKYPIIYGRAGGKSVWVEREVFSQLLSWQMVKRKASWLEWDANTLQEISKLDNEEFPKQIHGEDNFVKFLESKPEITDYLYNKIKDTLLSG